MSCTMCNVHIPGILTKMTLVEMGKSFHSQRALEMSRLAERWASQVLATSVNFCSSKYSLLKDQGALLYLLDGLTTQLLQFLTFNCVPFTLFNKFKGSRWLHLRSTTLWEQSTHKNTGEVSCATIHNMQKNRRCFQQRCTTEKSCVFIHMQRRDIHVFPAWVLCNVV